MTVTRPQWAGWYLDKDELVLRHETCHHGIDLLRCHTRTALLHEVMATTEVPATNDVLGGLCRALDDIFCPWLNLERGRWRWWLTERKIREIADRAHERYGGPVGGSGRRGVLGPPRPANPGYN
jgi:hypothetical protein